MFNVACSIDSMSSKILIEEVKDSGSLPLYFVLFYSINTLYCIKKYVFCAVQSVYVEQCNSF